MADYAALIQKVDESTLQDLDESEQSDLISLTLQLCPAQHRLGLITEELREKIVLARRLVTEKLGPGNTMIQFINRKEYQAGMTIQENLLFGKIIYSKRHLQGKIDQSLRLVLADLGLEPLLINVGLDFKCGNAGSRLSMAFRAKLALARALIKNPRSTDCL